MTAKKRKKKWLTPARKQKLGGYIIDMSKLLAGGYLLKYLTGERQVDYPQLAFVTFLWLLMLYIGLYLVAPKEDVKK